MTVKYLASQPTYCLHSKLTFEGDSAKSQLCRARPGRHLEENLFIHLTAPLSDAHWRPLKSSIELRLRWTSSKKAPIATYAKALEQLRQNSEETRLRIGNVAAVRSVSYDCVRSDSATVDATTV